MSDIDTRIQVQVAFKAAVELVAAGEIELETPDLGAELKEYTALLYDVITAVVDEKGGDSGNSRSTGKKSTGGSRKKASTRSGNTKKDTPRPQNPNKAASDAQVRFLKRLLDENDVSYDDDTFDWDGDDVAFDDLTMGSIQDYIEPLKG